MTERDEIKKVGGPQNMPVNPPGLLQILYPVGDGIAPSMNSVLVRSETFAAVGGFEDRFPRSFDDQAFLVKIYLHSTVFISGDLFDYYRQKRPGSITQVELIGPQRHRQRIYYYKWLKRYLGTKGLENSTPWLLAKMHLRKARLDFYRETSKLGRLLRWFLHPVKHLM